MLTAKNQLKKYGSQGVLQIPDSNGVYDPTTGDTTVNYTEYAVTYIPYPVSSEDMNNFGLAAFDGSFLSFMLVNANTGVLDVRPNSFIKDANGDHWDIQKTSPVMVKNKVILYQASTSVKR